MLARDVLRMEILQNTSLFENCFPAKKKIASEQKRTRKSYMTPEIKAMKDPLEAL